MSASRTNRRSKALKARKISQGSARIAKNGKCVLCERPGSAVVRWDPSPACSRRLGTPPGKVRVVLLALCQAHLATPDRSMAAAQEAIMVEAEAALRKPEAN